MAFIFHHMETEQSSYQKALEFISIGVESKEHHQFVQQSAKRRASIQSSVADDIPKDSQIDLKSKMIRF